MLEAVGSHGQVRDDAAGPERGELREHHGDEKQEETVPHPDVGHAGGFDGQHQDGHHKHIQHGPFAHVRHEVKQIARVLGAYAGIKPEHQHRVQLHEGRTRGSRSREVGWTRYPAADREGSAAAGQAPRGQVRPATGRP